MVDTEGSQCYIYPTIVSSTRPNYSTLPQDYFRLRINSNDSFSRHAHPLNNCYNFTIDFPPSTAESMQHRIAQCNRYQVIDFKLPIRNSKGIQVGRLFSPYDSPVKRFSPLTMTPSFLTTTNRSLAQLAEAGQFAVNKTKTNLLSAQDYAWQYEALREIHMCIRCSSLNEVFSRFLSKKLRAKASH